MLVRIIVSLIVLITLLIIWKRIRNKKAKEREMEQSAQDKLREKALDERILNKQHTGIQDEDVALPVEVNYDVGQIEHLSCSKAGTTGVMVQIIENTELSSKKYILDPLKGIKIGNVPGHNSILVDTGSKNEEQCEIIFNEGFFYLRNTKNSQNITLVRKKQRVLVGKQYLELKTGDGILFGNTFFRIEFIRIKQSR